MTVPMSEEQVFALAFYLWEQDGSPEGRSDDYWEKARDQLGNVSWDVEEEAEEAAEEAAREAAKEAAEETH